MQIYFKNFLALIFGLTLSMVLAEIFLHFYNPLPSRIRGNKIQLKTNLHKKIIINPKTEGLDSVISYSLNSIGFRGEEMPNDYKNKFSIFTVGGSTTECSLLSDNKTWPYLLGEKLKNKYPNIWINNAGVDGCSTYGHHILLDDYLIKFHPKMIIFMIGINDRGKADFAHEDGFLINRKEFFLIKLIKKSEVLNIINNLYLTYKTHQLNIGHNLNKSVKEKKNPINSRAENQNKNVKNPFDNHYKYQLIYKSRVDSLVIKCLDNGIIPVLVTQAKLDNINSNGWKIMEIYNQTTKTVAEEHHILCIDLGKEMEKKTSYFYDTMHFTNEGAESVAEILNKHLSEFINNVNNR